MKPILSIITPVFNEIESLPILINRLNGLMSSLPIDWELIIVDDGSSDETWALISNYKRNFCNIHAIKFSRNFGKDLAILAGLRRSKGDAAIVIDGDLQHPLELIPNMIEIWLKNSYLVVEACNYEGQNKGFILRNLSRLYYFLFKLLSGIDIYCSTDFKLIDRRVIEFIISSNENRFFFKGIVAWAGFSSYKIAFNPVNRMHGKSKWSFLDLLKHAFFTITSFSSRPLWIVTFFAISFLSLGLILSLKIIVSYIGGTYQPGILTLYVLFLIMGGLILTALSLIAVYIDRIFYQSKNRPLFIIEDD